MGSILIVEDEDFFRDILINVLKKKNHEVHGCADGKQAQYILDVQAFDVVISDINMPGLTGIQLAEWMKTKHPSMPLILMTGFSEILETKQAYALGVKEFLNKPFQQDTLLQAIDKILNKTETAPEIEVDRDAEFCKIRIEDFVSGKKIPFAIYIKLSKSKYIQIGEQGEDISSERIQSYKSKDVNYLYMRKEDFGNYVGYSINLAKVVTGSNKISKEKKLGFLKYTGEIIMENTYVNGVNEDTFRQAKDFMNNTMDVVVARDDAFNLLMMLNSHSDFLYAHSLGVSIYSVMIAKLAGWSSPKTVFTISIAALFHDIGKKEISMEILKKNRLELTQEEREIFETHPARGGEILSQVKGIPESVPIVAQQHHADVNGYGFPRGLQRSKIHPFAKLVNVANVFCDLALKSPSHEGMSGEEALKVMTQTKKEALDPQFVYLLQQIFSPNFDANRELTGITIDPDPEESGFNNTV